MDQIPPLCGIERCKPRGRKFKVVVINQHALGDEAITRALSHQQGNYNHPLDITSLRELSKENAEAWCAMINDVHQKLVAFITPPENKKTVAQEA